MSPIWYVMTFCGSFITTLGSQIHHSSVGGPPQSLPPPPFDLASYSSSTCSLCCNHTDLLVFKHPEHVCHWGIICPFFSQLFTRHGSLNSWDLYLNVTFLVFPNFPVRCCYSPSPTPTNTIIHTCPLTFPWFYSSSQYLSPKYFIFIS